MELSRHWWERLAVVTYWALLIVCAGFIWLLRSDTPYRTSWTDPHRSRHETAEAIGKRIGHPVYDAADKVVFFDPGGMLRVVRYNLVNEAIESGGHRAVPMVFPADKSFGYIPDNRVSEAAKGGFQVASIPEGFILESRGVDDEIPYWYLRRHPKWWQILLELYSVVLLSTLAFSYSLQAFYRAFVYVVRGNPQKALPTVP